MARRVLVAEQQEAAGPPRPPTTTAICPGCGRRLTVLLAHLTHSRVPIYCIEGTCERQFRPRDDANEHIDRDYVERMRRWTRGFER